MSDFGGSPDPQIIQLRGIIEHIGELIEDGSPKMLVRGQLGLARLLVKSLIHMHPELTAGFKSEPK